MTIHRAPAPTIVSGRERYSDFWMVRGTTPSDSVTNTTTLANSQLTTPLLYNGGFSFYHLKVFLEWGSTPGGASDLRYKLAFDSDAKIAGFSWKNLTKVAGTLTLQTGGTVPMSEMRSDLIQTPKLEEMDFYIYVNADAVATFQFAQWAAVPGETLDLWYPHSRLEVWREMR